MVFSKDGEDTIEDECKVFFAVLRVCQLSVCKSGRLEGETYKFGKEIPKRVFLFSFSHARSSHHCAFDSCAESRLHLVIQRHEQHLHTNPHQGLSLLPSPQPQATEPSELAEPADYPYTAAARG